MSFSLGSEKFPVKMPILARIGDTLVMLQEGQEMTRTIFELPSKIPVVVTTLGSGLQLLLLFSSLFFFFF